MQGVARWVSVGCRVAVPDATIACALLQEWLWRCWTMTNHWLPDLGSRPSRYFPQIGSTNDEAASWAREGAPSGAIVVADEQTAGRGRYRRIWQAAPGSSLLMSVILRPSLPPEHMARVTLMGAVALVEALSGLGLVPGIKWPNDVLLCGRKVSGILAETVWEGDRLVAAVLGMGINVRQDALPEAAARAFGATTLETVLGYTLDRAGLLTAILARLDNWQDRVGDPALLAAWEAHSITLGRMVSVRMGEQTLTGLAETIDPTGALMLRLDSGEQHRLLAGDVTLGGRSGTH